jgi:hypothetical protein
LRLEVAALWFWEVATRPFERRLSPVAAGTGADCGRDSMWLEW